jgi:NADPH-dependent ferric siderophore reductase
VDQSLPVSFVRVVAVTRVTPRMARITFGGDGLSDFAAWPDQQVKLCFPRPGQTAPRLPEQDPDGDAMRWYQAYLAIPEEERPWMRGFTIRTYHPESATIDIDFVLHGDDGPATRWAMTAKPADVLGMVGPSAVYTRTPDTSGWLLLVGDESALPAIGTLIESLPEGARAMACIEVEDAAEEQQFGGLGDVSLRWVHRSSKEDGLADVVGGLRFPEGVEVFAWLAGEAGMVRALRRHLVEERGLDKRAVEFSGYWRRRLTQDDAPTAEDLAEAQERLADIQAGGGSGDGGEGEGEVGW